MKRTKLQQVLAVLAPNVSIVTLWEHDNDCGPISKDCDGFTAEDDDKYQAWQSEVKATAIVNGEETSGNAYLGGTWEKVGDLPEVSNPEISGYEVDMTIDALEELDTQSEGGIIGEQIDRAVAYCKERRREAHKASQP